MTQQVQITKKIKEIKMTQNINMYVKNRACFISLIALMLINGFMLSLHLKQPEHDFKMLTGEVRS